MVSPALRVTVISLMEEEERRGDVKDLREATTMAFLAPSILSWAFILAISLFDDENSE